MEAARAICSPTAREARRFERECEALRPLGETFLLRRFAGQLSRADAEDAVAEVLIRLHRQFQAGRRPDNLRAAFFAAVRNAAIDQLRSRRRSRPRRWSWSPRRRRPSPRRRSAPSPETTPPAYRRPYSGCAATTARRSCCASASG